MIVVINSWNYCVSDKSKEKSLGGVATRNSRHAKEDIEGSAIHEVGGVICCEAQCTRERKGENHHKSPYEDEC